MINCKPSFPKKGWYQVSNMVSSTIIISKETKKEKKNVFGTQVM